MERKEAGSILTKNFLTLHAVPKQCSSDFCIPGSIQLFVALVEETQARAWVWTTCFLREPACLKNSQDSMYDFRYKLEHDSPSVL